MKREKDTEQLLVGDSVVNGVEPNHANTAFYDLIVGYAGTASISANIIKFSLGANAADTMTRIGRIGAAAGVYGMGINLATGVIYVGFYSSPGSQMFLPGTGNNLPTSVGTFPGQIWTNTAFQVSTACNILYTALYDTPGQVLYNDMGNGKGWSGRGLHARHHPHPQIISLKQTI